MDEMIKKSASVGGLEITDAELALINKQTIKALTAEQVFTFKVAICDNQIDRDYEKFSDSALTELSKLYVGKTIISDHSASSKNQCARIYSTEIVEKGEIKQLVAHCYSVRTESNKDFITEVEAGIKKEVSVGCRMGEVVCSVCGADNRKAWCDHYGGREYDGKQCYFTLNKALDAYEVSFVAVPAQPNAGVTKNYGGEKPKTTIEQDESDFDFEMKSLDAFLFVNKNLEEN